MSNLRKPFTIPPGRFVGGSMTEPKTTDAENKPLVYKSGPKAGQPRQVFDFAAAIPKAPGQTHWANKPADWDTNPATAGLPYWGEIIWALGNTAFPGIANVVPTFAWKVTDGDSVIPNKRKKRPCDQEGYPGNWVLWFSSEFAPRTFNANGTAPIDPKSIKPGHFIQVAGTVDTNASDNQPGVFLNHSLVAHAGFGPEIFFGPDPTQAGFGKGAAPAGMSQTPVGGLPAAAAPLTAAAPLPSPGPAIALPAPAPVVAAAPTVVQPHPGILNAGAPVPGAPAPAAPVAPAPAPPAGPVMTAKAGGAPWASFLAQGWTEATARANGYIS